MNEVALQDGQRDLHRRMTLSAATLFTAVALLGILRFSPKHLPVVVSVYWADAAVLGTAALWFLHARRLCWTLELRWIAQTGVWFLVLLTTAILGSSLVLSGPIPAQESLIQAARFTIYGCILLFMTDLAIRSRLAWEDLAGPIVIAALASNVLVAAVQLLNPPGLGSAVYALWGDEKLRTLASGYPRVFGTFFNANWFGVFVAWSLTYVVATRRVLVATPVRFGLMIAAALFLIVASGSRTGILATGVGVMVAGLLARRSFPGERRTIRAGAILTMVLTGVAFLVGTVLLIQRLDLDRFGRRFTELAMLLSMPGEAGIATLDARVRSWQNAMDVFMSAPIFGIGGSTATSGVAPHNGYIAMLMNFGALGAAGLAMFVVGMCWLCWGTLGHDEQSRRLRSWFLGFTAALSVAMFAGDFVYTSQLVFLWLLLAALVAGQANIARSQRLRY